MHLYTAKGRGLKKNVFYPSCVEISTLQDLLQATRFDHIAPTMKDNKRRNENFIKADVIMLDLDNTHSEDPEDHVTVNDVADAFPGVMFYYSRSRNHMKQKKKVSKSGDVRFYEPREKDHIYFPLSRSFIDYSEYDSLMLKVAALFPYMDLGACKPAQFFFGTREPEGGEITGDLYIDQFVTEQDPEVVVQSVESFYQKFDETDETKKAKARLFNYLGINVAAGSDKSPDDLPESISWIEEAEQRKRIMWLEEWASKYGVKLGARYRIDSSPHSNAIAICVECPWEGDHTMIGSENESVLIIDITGKLNYLCRHNCHVYTKTWKDYRTFFESRYDEKITTDKKQDPEIEATSVEKYNPDFFEWRDKKATKVIDINVCAWICENYDFFIMGDQPYFLDDTNCYKLDDGGVKMKRIIQSMIVPRLCKDSTITGIYRMILYQDKRKTYDELNQYPVEYVPFQNGFYDPINNRMVPIKPENYVINQIPHSYYPEKVLGSPVFDDLLYFQLPEDDARELWLEYCGSCFNRDTSGQKWMIIRGRGGTGKSTQLNILAASIGEDNISNETLQGLNERFNATNLFGKLVNLCADISSEDMKRIDVLKKITGEDRNGVKHEKKNKDCFFFTPFCKLLFSANEIPLNRDEKSDAFYRRLLITVIDKKPEKVDRLLQKKLLGEIDGIIHRYMEALRRFYERGGYYPECGRSEEEVRKLRRSTDSVISFIDDALVPDPEGKVERTALYRAYCTYCKQEERLYPVTRRTLFDRLRIEGISESRTSNARYFIGVRLMEEDFLDVGEEELPFVP